MPTRCHSCLTALLPRRLAPGRPPSDRSEGSAAGSVDRLAAAFDCFAPLYFLVHPFVRGIAVRAVRLLPHATPLNALDVCTGTGVVAEEMARHGHHVSGIDRSAGMLSQRRGLRGRLGIAGAQMDARRLAFADKSFDVCSISMALHEFAADDRRRLLAEMMRVSRRYVLVADYSGRQPWWVRLAESLEGSHFRDFMDGSLPEELRRAGLHIEREGRRLSVGVYLCRLPQPEAHGGVS